MPRRPPSSTRPARRFPYTPLCRSARRGRGRPCPPAGSGRRSRAGRRAVWTAAKQRSWKLLRLALAPLQIGLQGDGLVMGGVLRAVDQRHPAPRAALQQRRDRFRLRVALAEVALAEAVPLRRIMADPLATPGGTGRESCREEVWQFVEIPVVDLSLKKK